MSLSRRAFHRAAATALLSGAAGLSGRQTKPDTTPDSLDWVCPMDPDYRSAKPGVCPRCGMKLVLGIPERIEYMLEVNHSPEQLRPGQPVDLTFRVRDPRTGLRVSRFELVHEKLMHLFVVSENLQFFAHEHPLLQTDGSFTLSMKLPSGGMYRMLADYYPAGSVPQLSVETLFVEGSSVPVKLAPCLTPSKATNLSASLSMDPEQPLAGFETKLFYTLDPAEGLEPYLGAWGHMLAASADLIDLIHLHPFLATGGDVQFNVIFPRPGLYRIWTQFQRKGAINTVIFTVPVKAL
ncbi:MAG: hypothetical protein JO033_23530 [Acidobacteriaceae bacterium]|nr:hypothetical protein [Acidobacteriaceae bacterium]